VSDPSEGSLRAKAIAAHVERHIGPIQQVYTDTEVDQPIDVLYVPPTEDRRYHTLITSGMSARAMNVSPESDAPTCLELMATLPRPWNPGAAPDPGGSALWPLRELRRLARLPQQSKTWIGWGHTIPNGSPPQPFAPDTKLCGVIIVPSLMVPRGFYELATEGHTVTFYSIVPLYKEELALKDAIGMERLLARLIDCDVDDLIQPRRRNVARRKFLGLF
jgi:Suppressor of fused protein (SUFU)